MFVVKRDGTRESVKFDKITARIQKLSYGLEPARMMVGDDHDARCYLHGELADPERSE